MVPFLVISAVSLVLIAGVHIYQSEIQLLCYRHLGAQYFPKSDTKNVAHLFFIAFINSRYNMQKTDEKTLQRQL